MDKKRYVLRESQQRAITETINYFDNHQSNANIFLWNAVMRWGKCLTSLNLIEQYNSRNPGRKIENVLILTFFPQTEDSWSRLLSGGIDEQSNLSDFNFITVNSHNKSPVKGKVNIFFASFQEIYTGKERKQFVYDQDYELLILDEYHHGAYNSKAKSSMKQTRDEIFDADYFDGDSEAIENTLNYKMKLVLSGTPYKTYNIEGFNDKNSYTFTYFDEQRNKLQNGEASDYKSCPTLNLYSVRLNPGEIGRDEIEARVKFLMENNLFFNRSSGKSFFSSNPHPSSFWLIPSISDAKDIEQQLSKYDVNVINLYSRKYEANQSRTLEMVREDIASSGKPNVILSYNKLTLGVTIPEIESVVFLREITTPELYMQAASRSKSQYGEGLKQKNDVYLVSFDRIVDFSVFSQITDPTWESKTINEKEFLQLFPITFVDYDSEIGAYTLAPCDEKESFLNSLANVSPDEMIRKSVSPHIDDLEEIPPYILDELNKISEIGSGRSFLKKEQIEVRPEEQARREGYSDGKGDKLNRKAFDMKVPEKWKSKHSEHYKSGYQKGYAFEPKSVKEETEKKEKDEDVSALRKKIELIVRRFIYVTIATYFIEGRFIDFHEAPEDFFTSLMGIRKSTFLELHRLHLLNNDYIDSVINNFRSIENNNTNYAGLRTRSDYEMTVVSEEEAENGYDGLDIDRFKSAIAEMSKFEESGEEKSPSGKKYIYVAQPSRWIRNLAGFIASIVDLVKIKQVTEEAKRILDFIQQLTRGVKIGETTRSPSERLEELNGYTRMIGDSYILFDMHGFIEVPEKISDRDFHRHLQSKGYRKIEDDVRREIFDISPEKAMEELDEFVGLYKDQTDDGFLSSPTKLSEIDADLASEELRKPDYTYTLRWNGKTSIGSLHEIYFSLVEGYYESRMLDLLRVSQGNDNIGLTLGNVYPGYSKEIGRSGETVVYVRSWPSHKHIILKNIKHLIEGMEKSLNAEISREFTSPKSNSQKENEGGAISVSTRRQSQASPGKNFGGKGVYNPSDQSLTLKKGAVINMNSNSSYIRKKFGVKNDFYSKVNPVTSVLMQDIEFNSPSAASQFIYGMFGNGRNDWIFEDGRTINEVFPSEDDES